MSETPSAEEGRDLSPFLSVEDFKILFRPLSHEELERFDLYVEVVSDALRQEARNVGEDLDDMVRKGDVLRSVLKVTVSDIVARALTQPTDQPRMADQGVFAGVDGNYLPSTMTGLFIKNAELARLGLKAQTIFRI